METAEFENLDRVERDHWYYAGKRELVGHWIERCRPLRASDTLLDFGAGSGRFALAYQGKCQVKVCDSFPEARALLARRFPSTSILEPREGLIPLEDQSVDVVTALDVIEHIRDDSAVVSELHRILRRSGLCVITVPADPRLWSDWDVSLHHFRRYTRASLLALFPAALWDVHHAAYTNTLAWPVVLLLRRMRARVGRTTASGGRAEDRIPPRWLNHLLRWLFVAPARQSWLPKPGGVSLILVARKR